jgi:hypothetical protein
MGGCPFIKYPALATVAFVALVRFNWFRLATAPRSFDAHSVSGLFSGVFDLFDTGVSTEMV